LTEVHVFVRLGVDKIERVITFVIPKHIVQTDLLDVGIAVDGNQGILVAASPKDLLEKETLVRNFLKDHNCTTVFK
jgi:hypothetical protein